jgi:hypothetical protein
MLRVFVLLLLAANGIFYAWSNDYLSAWGWAASSQREAFRLKEQIEPERILVRQTDKPTQNSTLATSPVTSPTTSPITSPVPTASAPIADTPSSELTTSSPVITPSSTVATASAAPTICLTSGIFNDRQSNAIKQALDSKLPNLPWRFEIVNLPARWIVYMGKYANNSVRDQKKSQLDQIKVPYSVLTERRLEPGLSLGSHSSQAAANQALQNLIKQGVRTARVLQELPEEKGQNLVVPAIDEATLTKLNAIFAGLTSQLAGKSLETCKK